MVRTVPSEVIDAALQIIDMAKSELDCELNPHVVLTLAGYLHFAVERLKDGCVIENPLSDTVEFVYPVEHGRGLRALAILEKETGGFHAADRGLLHRHAPSEFRTRRRSRR